MDKQVFPNNAKKVHNGIKFDIYHWEQELFDGTKAIFEKATHIPSVQIIAIVGNKIAVLEEKQPYWGNFISLIGGAVDKGEEPIAAAKRELLEETGMKCEKMEFLEEAGETGHIHWNSYYYIARNCKKIKEQNLDAGERINIKLVDFDGFIKIVADTNFRNKGFALKILRMYYNNELDEFKDLLFTSKN